MLDSVLVSIVIPVYNTKAEFIKECIESIVDIKYPHETSVAMMFFFKVMASNKTVGKPSYLELNM